MYLVEDSSIVRRDIVGIEKETFLYCSNSHVSSLAAYVQDIRTCSRRLKLVIGVDNSTRPVNRSGREGKVMNRRRRTIVAAPKTATVRLSSPMVVCYLAN